MNIWEPAGRLNIGDVVYPPGGAFGPRLQRNLQLVYVWSGEATVWIDGSPVLVESGHGILLRPHHRERFRFARGRETHHGWCEVVDARLTPDAHSALGAVAARAHPVPALISTLAPLALRYRGDSRWTAREVHDGLCRSILYEFLQAAGCRPAVSVGASGQPLPGPVARALDIVHREYALLTTVGDIASHAGVTPQHLGRLFAEHVGPSPVEYLWKVRTEHAVELVRSTGLTIAAIADQCGFRTPFHLSRRVRDAVGASPTEIRSATRTRSQALWP